MWTGGVWTVFICLSVTVFESVALLMPPSLPQDQELEELKQRITTLTSQNEQLQATVTQQVSQIQQHKDQYNLLKVQLGRQEQNSLASAEILGVVWQATEQLPQTTFGVLGPALVCSAAYESCCTDETHFHVDVEHSKQFCSSIRFSLLSKTTKLCFKGF